MVFMNVFCPCGIALLAVRLNSSERKQKTSSRWQCTRKRELDLVAMTGALNRHDHRFGEIGIKDGVDQMKGLCYGRCSILERTVIKPGMTPDQDPSLDVKVSCLSGLANCPGSMPLHKNNFLYKSA
jgi:hypothetical protein